jgi:hypothetical protein
MRVPVLRGAIARGAARRRANADLRLAARARELTESRKMQCCNIGVYSFTATQAGLFQSATARGSDEEKKHSGRPPHGLQSIAEISELVPALAHHSLHSLSACSAIDWTI